MDQKVKRRIFWIVGAIVLVPIGLIATAIAYLSLAPRQENYAHRAKFESAGWSSESRDQTSLWPTRLRMIDDLVASKRLDGLQRGDVTALLGPADKTDYFTDWDLVYWLGPERGLIRIDSEWLVLRFDESGRVAEYRVARD
jgi:hypothetical protein